MTQRRGEPRSLPTAAVIDIGSNTVHMLVAALTSDGGLIPLARDRQVLRLGADVAAAGSFSAASMQRCTTVVESMVAACAPFGVTPRIVATSAVREAANGVELAQHISRRTEVAVDILDGLTEAALSWRGVVGDIAVATSTTFTDLLVVDIGGNSTEAAYGNTTGGISTACSLPIGAVRLTTMFFPGAVTAEGSLARCRAHVQQSLATADALPLARSAHSPIACTGGVSTTLAGLIARSAGSLEQSHAPSGLGIDQRSNVVAVVDTIVACASPEQRAALPGMHQDRADVIAAGALILQGVLAEVDGPVLLSPSGLREGVLRQLLDD